MQNSLSPFGAVCALRSGSRSGTLCLWDYAGNTAEGGAAKGSARRVPRGGGRAASPGQASQALRRGAIGQLQAELFCYNFL